MKQISRAGIIVALIALFAAMAGLFSSETRAQRDARTLIILHTNDLHGHLKPHVYKQISEKKIIGGSAYLTAMVNVQRKKHPGRIILLDAGDVAQGPPISNLFRGRPVLEIMNTMKYDAMVLGNHEFDWGRKALKNIIKWAQFPVLSANVTRKSPMDSFIPGVRPYIIKEVNGIKIGVIGITTPETRQTTVPDNVKGLIFNSPDRVLIKTLPEMKKKGAKFIIVLSHLGYRNDVRLAREVKGINVIVGGHSHTTLKNVRKVGDTLVVQAGAHGNYLGRLEIKLNPANGRVVHSKTRHELIPVISTKIKPDPAVEKIVSKYNNLIKRQMAQVVGNTPIDLTLSGKGVYADSSIGNLVCDCLVYITGADAALHNTGGIRSNIYKGAVTMEEIYTAFPFDDRIVTMDIKGRNLIKILEHGVKKGGAEQVSGITFDVDYSAPPGKRVSDVKIKGQKINLEKYYRLSTIDFLYNGGDGYNFKDVKNVTLGPYIREAILECLHQRKEYKSVLPGRIRVIRRMEDG